MTGYRTSPIPAAVRRYERLGRRGAWAVALLAPPATAALMVPVRSHTQASNLALVMVAVVGVTVVPGFRAPALLAGLSAGIWFDFFLTPPYETFFIERGGDIQTAVLMTVVAVLAGSVAARRRQAGERAQRSGDEVMGLYVSAQMLSAGDRAETVVGTVSGQIRDLLFLTSCHFDPGYPADTEPIINRAGDLDWRGHNWSISRHGWPSVPVSLPIDSRGERVGRFLLSGPAEGGQLTLDRVLTALALADLAGAALGRDGRAPAHARPGRS